MREIKFRAWHKVQKRMFDVAAIAIDKTFVLEKSGIKWDFKLIELMEYSGFRDSKKKKIYESDIISINYEDGPAIGSVELCDGFFGFNVIEATGRHPAHFSPFHENDSPKIIGNIYENPKLLAA